MTKPTDNPTPSRTLRERAEEMLTTSHTDINGMSADELQGLVHELQVHQMELEIQNEDLRGAQIELAHSRDRYSDLYEFAPVGYLSLDRHGVIEEANLTAAAMLGVERKRLTGRKLTDFLPDEAQETWHLYRREVFAGSRSRQTLDGGALHRNSSDRLDGEAGQGQSLATSATDAATSDVESWLTKQTCELEMHKTDGDSLTVRLESLAVADEDGNLSQCRTALIDVSNLRHARQQLQESERRYRRLTDAVTDYIYRVRIDHGQAVETIHGANCEAVTGYSPEEFQENPLLWIAMVPPEDRAVVERQAAGILSNKDAPPLEHRIQRRDGAIRWVLNTTSPQHDDQGRLIGYDGLLRDISERKRAEDALRQLNEELEHRVDMRTADLRARTDQLAAHSRELEQREQEMRLQAEAISNLGEGVLITSDHLEWPGPQIVFVNEAMCRITGYTADELIGQSPRILQGNGSDRETLDRIKTELSAGHSCQAELVNYRKGGTPYDADLFITPLFDSQGRHTNFVSIHRDITERKQAEAALHDREERLRAILNAAVNSIITIDAQGRIITCNAATERLFGYSESELTGQNVSMLMPSPYREEHDGYIARYLETGEARIIGIGREVVGQRKNGSTFPANLSVSEVHRLGLFTGIISDITARKAAEEALRREHEFAESLTDTAPTIVLVLDIEGRIIRFNPYMEELTGWQLDEVKGRDWFDTFLPEHDREQIRSLFSRSLSGERTRGNTNVILTKDGREREIEWYDAPLTSVEGELIGLLCTGLDVTERRLLEREILEIAAEEQRRIGQDLHDSTQQQLTGLSLLAQNLAAAFSRLASDPAVSGLADRVAELGEKATQLQTGLEDAAGEVNQLARGLIPVEVDAQGLMSSLSELALRVNEGQHVDCTFVSNLPVEVSDNTTATHLYRIAQEAVSNALKHSTAERIEISLEEHSRFITLKIFDDGSGFDQDQAVGPGMGLRIMAYRAELIGASLAFGQSDAGGAEVVCQVRH
jgi:PAS domain S-box-containing protein